MKALYHRLIIAGIFFIVLMMTSSSVSTAQSNALHFDGVDDFVIVPNGSNQIAGAPGISLSMWVYPTNPASGWPNFDGFGGFRNDANCDFYICQLSSTGIEARFRNSSGTTFDINSASLVLNVWQHYVLTYNGNTLALYRNGVLLNSVPASGTIANATVPLYIGKLVYSFNNFSLMGKVDEFSVWSKALTAAEVTALHSGVINTSDAALKLYYKFDQGVANGNNAGITTLIDNQGTANGTLTNFALNGTTSNWVEGVMFAMPADAGIQSIHHPADTICGGTQPVEVILRNWGPNPLAAVTIGWNINGTPQAPFSWTGNIAPNSQDTVTIGNYPFHQDTTYSLVTWTSMPNGAADTATANDTATLGGIFVKPIPLLTALPTSHSICQGDTAFLTGTLSGTPPWNILVTTGTASFNFPGISNPGISLPVTPAQSTTYTISILSDGGGCPNPTPVTLSVIVSAAPPANITPMAGTACCDGDSVMLMANIGAGLTYQWKRDGIDIPGATNYVFAARQSGAYTLKVTGTTGCSALSPPVSVFVHPNPQVFLGNDTTIAANHAILLNAGPGFNSYLWSTGATSASLIVDSTGTGEGTKSVWVHVTDNYNCVGGDTINITFVINPGIAQVSFDRSFSLHPNPSAGLIHLGVEPFAAEITLVALYTMEGKKVHEEQLPLQHAGGNVTVTLNHLPDGIYLVRAINLNGEALATGKLILQR